MGVILPSQLLIALKKYNMNQKIIQVAGAVITSLFRLIVEVKTDFESMVGIIRYSISMVILSIAYKNVLFHTVKNPNEGRFIYSLTSATRK